MKSFLNAAEVAKLQGVDRATVTRWIRKGFLKGAVKLPGRRDWQIPLTSYQEFIKQMSL